MNYTKVDHAKMDHVDPSDFHKVMKKLRPFFEKKGMLESYLQNRRNIMAACEDPKTISTYIFDGQVWPLPQTTQMGLEELILNDKKATPGYWSLSTSYRDEPNPVPGRHNSSFPLLDFEVRGGFDDLLQFERELLEHLGYGSAESFPDADYEDLCTKFGTDDLTHEHEQALCDEYGPIFFIKNFPERSDPFWNMGRDPNNPKIARKCDVIMSGQETVGSAARSNDRKQMRESFHTVSNGEYAGTLYHRFKKDRVEKELDDYLNYDFFDRSGGGIGITRLIRSLKMEGLFDDVEKVGDESDEVNDVEE